VTNNQDSLHQIATATLNESREANRKMMEEYLTALRDIAGKSTGGFDEAREASRKLMEEYAVTLNNITTSSKGGFDQIEDQLLKNINAITEKIQESLKQGMDLNKTAINAHFDGKLGVQQEIINRHSEIVKKYEELINLEREKLQKVMTMYDVTSIVFDKNHYEEMMRRENRLIETMDTLGNRVAELVAEFSANLDRVRLEDASELSVGSSPTEPNIVQ
jgi:gas vesicle protein